MICSHRSLHQEPSASIGRGEDTGFGDVWFDMAAFFDLAVIRDIATSLQSSIHKPQRATVPTAKGQSISLTMYLGIVNVPHGRP